MTSISKTDQALYVALTRALEPARPVDAGAIGGQPAEPVPTADAVPTGVLFDLDTDVRQRVERISRDAPDRRARILRALLESCVARTFGASAPSDPGFRHVIDQVHDAMRSNSELSEAMDRLVTQFDGPFQA